MGFIIRLPASGYKKELNEQRKYHGEILKKIRRGKVVDTELTINGKKYRFVGKENPNPENADDDLLLLLTNTKGNKNKVIARYGIRWQIEYLFKCLKTNGFRMEDLGLTNPSKVR
jgi:IS4 transposase